MPLPAALLARLAKRGIVEKKEPTADDAKPDDANEEVFAEDYDDPSKPEVNQEEEREEPVPMVEAEETVTPVQQTTESEPLIRDTTKCPFRSNRYHTCVPYCKKTYGMREWEPDNKMLTKRDRMLMKHPLPEGWLEVGDPVTNRYYYWNVLTDQVSWLSPTHPKADVTQSAEHLGLIGKIGPLDSDGEEAMEAADSDNDDDNASQKSGSDTSLSDEEEMNERDSKLESRLFRTPPEPPAKQKDDRKSRGKAEDLDPMDPASYSDISRGGWSDGLDLRGSAKTGVDQTASGPLFQQRPYPSPGDILRANQALKKKK